MAMSHAKRGGGRLADGLVHLSASVASGLFAVPVGELAARALTGWHSETEQFFALELLASVLVFGPLGWIAFKERKAWVVGLAGLAGYGASLAALLTFNSQGAEPGALRSLAAFVVGAVAAVVVMSRSLGVLYEAKRPR